jgi:DNA-binding CsgD family transcriptional regulator
MELQQYSRLVLDLHEASRALAPVAFQDWAIARLRRDLPFTSARWSLDALSGHEILHSACYGTRPDLDRELHAISERDDVFQRMTGNMGVTAIKNGHSDDRFLRRFDQRHDLHSVLATAVPDANGKLLQMISLYRSESAPPFTDDERMLKQMLAPHLMQAWQGSWSYAPLTLDEPQALLSFDGFVIDAEPRFSAMLRAAWPGWCGRRIVLTAGGFDAPASATAKVCIVPVAGGAPGTQRVLIRANRCGVLTARERAVAAHYAAGLSYKEIAKALGISPDTVRSYIKCCYAKLEVCNKVQLQAALGAA